MKLWDITDISSWAWDRAYSHSVLQVHLACHSALWRYQMSRVRTTYRAYTMGMSGLARNNKVLTSWLWQHNKCFHVAVNHEETRCVSFFTLCSWMSKIKELVPYSVHSPSEVSTCLVFLLTQTNKRCIRGLLTNNERPANNTCNRENIWNSSFVTKSMLIIFINLQTTNACMSSRPTSGWQ